MAEKKVKKEKKTKKKIAKSAKVAKAVVHIKNTFNNTIVTISDPKGNTLGWASAGALNFRGARKSTPYASGVVATAALENASKYGISSVEILVNGPGYGRESAIRAVVKSGLNVSLIKDVTGIPHNGCRPRKLRRG